MKNILTKILSGTIITAFALVLNSSVASAVGVKPLRTELTIEPGESAIATIRVINDEDINLRAKAELEIYTKNDAEGFPVVETISDDHPMNIRSWIGFSDPIVSLEPKSEKEVSFKVTIPEDAEPGGRYASIVYAPIEDEVGDNVQIRARVASLILITVAGEEKHEGIIKTFGPKGGKFYNDQQPIFVAEFLNEGNVHLKPRGGISLFDPENHQLSKIAHYVNVVTGEDILSDEIPINFFGGNVLPGSFRNFEGEWNKNIRSGKYVAKLKFQYAIDKPIIERDIEVNLNDEISIDDFQLVKTAEAADFTVTITNTGNVYERLIGNVEVRNNYDKVVATPVIPEDAEYVVPGETATITIPWLSKEIPDGRYTAKLIANYGFDKISIEAGTKFSIGRDSRIMIFVGIAIAIVIVIGVDFMLRRKKKKD